MFDLFLALLGISTVKEFGWWCFGCNFVVICTVGSEMVASASVEHLGR